MGDTSKTKEADTAQTTRLMPEKAWQEILHRAALGESTQADTDALIEECVRVGRQALAWRQLVNVWNEYANSLRKTMLRMSADMRREVGKDDET